MDDKLVIKELTETVKAILNGEITKLAGLDQRVSNEGSLSCEIEELYDSIKVLSEKHLEATQFMLRLSKGDLEQDPPKLNFLISPFKDLHSSLRQLIWQTQRIAEGDYNQHINFMGDFSTSFNRLIEALKEKQSAEAALQKSEERSRLFLENSTDLIFVLNLEMKLIYISPSCFAIFGYTDTEHMSMPMNDIYSDDELLRQKKLIQESINNYKDTGENKIISYEGEGRHKDGHSLWIETTTRLLLDKTGSILGVQGGARDISQRRIAEDSVRQKNQDLEELNATKDKFFSIIAHDLRGPVGSMNSLFDLISDPGMQMDKERYFELLNVMKDVSKTTFDLLENLLIWANSQRGYIEYAPKYYNLNKLVEQTISLFSQAAHNKGITLLNNVSSSSVGFFDYNMINTIIRNLVNNAIKYTDLKGEVSISAKETAEYLQVYITDTGTGMNKETVDKLFKLDTVSKSVTGTNGESGTGLGLLLCKEFTDKHSGKIRVESNLGKGSTFIFELPKKLFA